MAKQLRNLEASADTQALLQGIANICDEAGPAKSGFWGEWDGERLPMSNQSTVSPHGGRTRCGFQAVGVCLHRVAASWMLCLQSQKRSSQGIAELIFVTVVTPKEPDTVTSVACQGERERERETKNNLGKVSFSIINGQETSDKMASGFRSPNMHHIYVSRFSPGAHHKTPATPSSWPAPAGR